MEKRGGDVRVVLGVACGVVVCSEYRISRDVRAMVFDVSYVDFFIYNLIFLVCMNVKMIY